MEEILNTILKEIRELNVKVDAILASSKSGGRKSLTGISEKQTEEDLEYYLRMIAKKYAIFPGLNMLTEENLRKYSTGELSLESIMASIGSTYSKRASFYNLLKDLRIVSNGKYDFVRTRGE